MPNLSAGFVCYIAAMGRKTVNLQKVGGGTIAGTTVLPRRFDALKLETTNGTNFTSTPIEVIGGSTCLLPAGVFKIGGVGLKLHPAINLAGQGMGSSVLTGATNLAGTQDTVATYQYPALLTIAARSHPLGDKAGDPTYSWQPTVSDLTLIGDAIASQGTDPDDNITGCLVENGNSDPRYPVAQQSTDGLGEGDDIGEYKASSARFVACGVYGFKGHGVISHGERQRFYSEHLRSVGNNGYGLLILGSDPVIGPRTGLGSNGLHGLSCKGNAGVLVSGANIWKAKTRGATALACEIRNVNGCSIVNTVFDDTLLLAGTDVTNKGVSVTGCDFRPNQGIFDPITGVIIGITDPAYNTFVSVSGLRNVTLGNNSYCVEADDHAYERILYAAGGSRVNITAAVSTESGVANYAASTPIAIAASPDTTVVDYDLRDVFNGARYVGSLSNAATADQYPAARGAGLIDRSAVADFKGYRIYDGGPLLQAYAPDFTDTALQFETPASGDTITIKSSARYLYVLLSGNLSALTLRLPTAAYHKQLRVVVRGGNIITLTWQVAAGSGDTITDSAFRPARVAGLMDVQLVRKRAVNPTPASWYVANSERLSMFVQVGTDNEALAVSTTVQVATLRAPRPMQVTEVRGSLRTAPSGAGSKVEFDIRKNVGGTRTSIFTTKPTINSGAFTTVGATPSVFKASEVALPDDQELGIFVTAIGSTLPGKGLKVWVVGQTA